MRLMFLALLVAGILHAKAAPCQAATQRDATDGITDPAEVIRDGLYADVHRPVPSGGRVHADMEQEGPTDVSMESPVPRHINPVRWGPTVEANWYSLRDFDPTWGISLGLYRVHWHGLMGFYLGPPPRRQPEAETASENIIFAGLRLGWFPFEGYHQDDVTHTVYAHRTVRTVTQNVGFSYEGHVYSVQFVTTGLVPLNDTFNFVLRTGSGLSWIEIREVSDIIVDGTDHTDDFTFEHDYSVDWHWLIGAGLEARTRDARFSAGALIGYRFVLMEHWGLGITYRDPRTGRERTMRRHGVEWLGGMARGVTGDLYLRYAF